MNDRQQFLIRFGANLSRIRTERNYSINELASRSGVDIAVLIQVEAGNYDLDILGLLDVATALDMEPKELMQ